MKQEARKVMAPDEGTRARRDDESMPKHRRGGATPRAALQTSQDLRPSCITLSHQPGGATNQAQVGGLRYRWGMRILLVRHGEAVPYDTTPVDELRWLTAAGRAGVRDVAQALAQRGVRLTQVFTSPLVRAVQTCEILVQHVHPASDVPVSVHVGLAAEEGSITQALAPLAKAGEDDVIALVTHMPKVSAMAAYLTGNQRFEQFATGAVYMLSRSGNEPCTVEFTLSPGHL